MLYVSLSTKDPSRTLTPTACVYFGSTLPVPIRGLIVTFLPSLDVYATNIKASFISVPNPNPTQAWPAGADTWKKTSSLVASEGTLTDIVTFEPWSPCKMKVDAGLAAMALVKKTEYVAGQLLLWMSAEHLRQKVVVRDNEGLGLDGLLVRNKRLWSQKPELENIMVISKLTGQQSSEQNKTEENGKRNRRLNCKRSP